MTEIPPSSGLARGLTHYGDPDFALFLRRSFARSMGYSTRCSRAADRRHCEFGERLQQLPSAPARADRGGQARRARGRRPAARLPDDLAGRGVSASDEPRLPQPDGDGHRGDVPRAAARCGGARRRLRQDGAGAADGRDLRRRAGHPARRRADADGPLRRRAARRVHRLPPFLGQVPRGEIDRGRDRRHRDAARDDRRHVCGDGDGQHDGVVSPKRWV